MWMRKLRVYYMSELLFKKEKRMSACTNPPWAIFIPPRDRPEILRLIRQECIDIYGYAFDECSKRMTCFKKECLGRTLPWESKTAKPYLDKLKQSQPDKFNEVDEYIIQTDCSQCPIVNVCKSPCNQVLDFIEREKVGEPLIDFKENTEQLKINQTKLETSLLKFSGEDIPWDILPKRKQDVIKKYLYEGRDFRNVGESLGLTNQARAKYEFYSALTKLSEYAKVRNFLNDHYNELTVRQQQIFSMVYIDNMSFIEVAKELKISKQSVQQTVARVLRKYKITWKTYVRKHKNKVIYNVPQLFKSEKFQRD